MPLLDGLHVDGDVSLTAETFPQAVLDSRGAVVSDCERQVSVHAHMGLDGEAVADATRAQVVRLAHVGE